MQKKQVKEGKLKGCRGYRCNCGCCNDQEVDEWINEYYAFHDQIKDAIVSRGIGMQFIGDRVFFTNCSDGKNCKFLDCSSDKSIDLRPIDCKIYPYAVDWDTIDFDKKIVKLYYWDKECPLANSNSISSEFKREVAKILDRDFTMLFFGAKFKFQFVNQVIDHQYANVLRGLIVDRLKHNNENK